MPIDWTRAITERAFVDGKKTRRIIYQNETRGCKNCRFYTTDVKRKSSKPVCTNNQPISEYSRACVIYEEKTK